MDDPVDAASLRVGVVGTGPWAHLVHAPMFAVHPHTTLTAVWGRRQAAAEDVAGPLGAVGTDSFARFLDLVDAVSFAVPPDVQAPMAADAARAGKALLLEKPVALDPAAARSLVDAVAAAGVPTQLLLTWRYRPDVRALLAGVAGTAPLGGRGWFLGNAFLGGRFATPWRLDRGPLFDLGPHVLDLLDAAIGPIVGVRAHGDPRRWVGLLCDHRDGTTSEVSLTGHSPVEDPRAGVEVHTDQGVFEVDTSGFDPAVLTTVVDEFVATASGRPQPLDLTRGMHLQDLLARAATDLEWA
jgi:predicted dehydrogenase